MEYSSMAAVALIVHYIVNHNAFANRHYGSDTPAGKALRRLILCIAVFFVSDEFVVLLEGEEYKKRKSLVADFELATEKNMHSGEVVIASGLAVFRPGNDNSFRRVFERADARMYDRKGLLKSMEE